MRLPAEVVKQHIQHEDQSVRQFAIDYFADAFASDADLMPAVIKVIEQYGWDDAFVHYEFLCELAQDAETLRWVVHQLRRHHDGFDHDAVWGLERVLHYSDPGMLPALAEQLAELTEIDPHFGHDMKERRRLLGLSADELRAEFDDYCRAFDEGDTECGLYYDLHLAEAMSRQPQAFAELALSTLRETPSRDEPGTRDFLAARLAGLLRLEEACPYLAACVDAAEDWLDDECSQALVRIGSPAAVKALVEVYRAGGQEARLGAAWVLADIRSDGSVRACLELLADEEDTSIRRQLCFALIKNLAREGTELARLHLLRYPWGEEERELRDGLFRACAIAGTSFPELADWKEAARLEAEERLLAEQRRAWVPVVPEIPSMPADGPIVSTFRHEEPRIGRNDSCPCGSGKKFKKCCMGKKQGWDPINSL